MLSIQEVSRLTGLTSRALRLYEEVGILSADRRAAGGARLYAPASVERLKQILAMKAAGITLADMSTLLDGNGNGTDDNATAVDSIFRSRLEKIESQITSLQERRDALRSFLTTGPALGTDVQRAFRMTERERLELFALQKLDDASSSTSLHAAYLKTELDCLNAQPEAYALIPAAKRVVEFAAAHAIPIGPGRSSTPASLLFHLLGLSKRDPVQWGLKPAVAYGVSKSIWLDVSFTRGKPLIELCEELSQTLKPWRIEAFRMPLLDIIDNVHARLGAPVRYDDFADDSPEVLTPFRNADCELIHCFDEPANTMAERLFPEQLGGWAGFERMNATLRARPVTNFADVLKLMALRRPKTPELAARIDEYTARRLAGHDDMIIFHEDVINLIEAATPWGPVEANRFRYRAFRRQLTDADREAFLHHGDEAALATIERAAPFGFSKAHTVGFGELVKRTAILKTLHRDVYFDEVRRFEDTHGLSWSDFGFHDERVCLLK